MDKSDFKLEPNGVRRSKDSAAQLVVTEKSGSCTMNNLGVRNKNQKNFVVDFKIADGKFNNLN